MLDVRLRSHKDRLLAPIAERCFARCSVVFITALGLALCVAAGVAAWRGLAIVAVVLWLAGRTLDGLDGAVARRADTASDVGGYFDILADTVGYAAVPIGIAAGADTTEMWQVVAVLLATFYVNSVSWLMLSALLEKRSAGAAARGEQTSVAMPIGLIEGTETIVIFTAALAFPSAARWLFVAMAVGVTIGVGSRAVMARRLLGATTSADRCA